MAELIIRLIEVLLTETRAGAFVLALFGGTVLIVAAAILLYALFG